MAGQSESWLLLMNTHGNAYLSPLPGVSDHRMFSINSIICSSVGAHRIIYVRTPEFTAKAVRKWLSDLGIATLFIEPGSPWENGYVESFNGKLRDELLNLEIFNTLLETRVILNRWRREYNCCWPHSALGYRPPAPQAFRTNNLSLKLLH